MYTIMFVSNSHTPCLRWRTALNGHIWYCVTMSYFPATPIRSSPVRERGECENVSCWGEWDPTSGRAYQRIFTDELHPLYHFIRSSSSPSLLYFHVSSIHFKCKQGCDYGQQAKKAAEAAAAAALRAPGASCETDTDCDSGSCRGAGVGWVFRHCCAYTAHIVDNGPYNDAVCEECAASTGDCSSCKSPYYLDSGSKCNGGGTLGVYECGCKSASGTTTAVVIVVVVILIITAV